MVKEDVEGRRTRRDHAPTAGEAKGQCGVSRVLSRAETVELEGQDEGRRSRGEEEWRGREGGIGSRPSGDPSYDSKRRGDEEDSNAIGSEEEGGWWKVRGEEEPREGEERTQESFDERRPTGVEVYSS